MEPISVKEKKTGKMEGYEIESCIDTLIKAEEIKADKNKMKQIWPMIEKRKKAILSFDDLLDAKADVDAEDEGDEE
jgi:regulator of sigma D